MFDTLKKQKTIIFLCMLSLITMFLLIDIQKKHEEYAHLVFLKKQSLRKASPIVSINNDNKKSDIKKIRIALSDILKKCIEFSEQEGFFIQSIHPQKKIAFHGITGSLINITMTGDMTHLNGLLLQFSTQTMPWLIDELTFQRKSENNIMVELRLLILHVMTASIKESNDKKMLLDSLNHYSYRDMKWVGYSEENNETFGFIQQPDGTVEKIGVGSVFGKEKARVVQLNHDCILLDIDEKKTVWDYVILGKK